MREELWSVFFVYEKSERATWFPRCAFCTPSFAFRALCIQVLAEFCAQDEDGQTPLLFAARSGSGAVFRQALEALLARAAPEKVHFYVINSEIAEVNWLSMAGFQWQDSCGLDIFCFPLVEPFGKSLACLRVAVTKKSEK